MVRGLMALVLRRVLAWLVWSSTPRTWKSWSFATKFRCRVGTSAGLGSVGATASSSLRRAATCRGRPGAPYTPSSPSSTGESNPRLSRERSGYR
jgi:hypothetical protein